MHGKDKRNVTSHKRTRSLLQRRRAVWLIGMGLTTPLAACWRTVQKEIWLNVVMNSYVDRIHTNIFFNDTTLGVTAKFGTTGTIVGVRIPFGVQTLRWELDGPEGTPRIGEVVNVKNQLVILPEQIWPGTRYLGLHLYPDDTAEITFTPSIPEKTDRGEEILAARKR
jgi:hypothetical protein